MRACCHSQWRLSDDPTQLRSGFYWFCPEQTPFYPGLHNLGSRDWTSSERVPWPNLGEYQGARSWHDGTPPALPPRAVQVGTNECIAEGYPSTLPVVSPVDPFCEQILPPACYGVFDSMAALSNPLDCLFANRSAKLLGLRYSSDVAAEAYGQSIFGPTAVLFSGGTSTDTFPQVTCCKRDGQFVIWICGTTNFQQLALQAFYAGNGPINQGMYSCGGLYETAAANVIAFLSGAGAGATARIVLVGHSYGGAVAVVAAAKLLIANPGRNVQLMTFGAPKAGDERLYDLIAERPQVHYWDSGDPVPFFPPTGVLAAVLIPIIGPTLASLWPRFFGPKRIRVVNPDGTIVDYDRDDAPSDSLTVVATAIASVISPPAFRDHDVNWYGYYICLGCTCVPRPCTPPPPPALNFRMLLRNFQYKFGGAIVSDSVRRDGAPLGTIGTITGHFANGLPSNWRIEDPTTHFSAELAAAAMSGSNYTTFRLSLSPFPIDPVWLTYWDFTSSQLDHVIPPNPPPAHFEKKLPTDFWGSIGEIILEKIQL